MPKTIRISPGKMDRIEMPTRFYITPREIAAQLANQFSADRHAHADIAQLDIIGQLTIRSYEARSNSNLTDKQRSEAGWMFLVMLIETN